MMRKKTVHILSKIFCIAGMMLFCIIAIKSTVYAAKGDVKINKKISQTRFLGKMSVIIMIKIKMEFYQRKNFSQ